MLVFVPTATIQLLLSSEPISINLDTTKCLEKSTHSVRLFPVLQFFRRIRACLLVPSHADGLTAAIMARCTSCWWCCHPHV